jgi:two-component sensor histidine kinase
MTRLSLARPRSLRQHLGLLTLVLALPMLVLATALGALQVTGAQEELDREARADARLVLHRAEQLVQERVAALRRTAAESREGRLDSPGESLLAAAGLHLALLDPAGAVIHDTRPPGAPLHEAARQAALRLEASGRLLSGLVEDAASGGHALLVTADVPDGVLVLALPADAFRAVLTEVGEDRFSPTRFPALSDVDGRIVARSTEHERFVGRLMPAPARAVLLAGPEGRWDGRNLTGHRVRVVHVASTLTGLAVGMGILHEALVAPYWRSALLLGPAALGLLALAAGATLLVARRIGEPVSQLGAAARTLAEGTVPPRLETPLAEVNRVAAAMAEAAERRKVVEAQRDLLVLELHHRVKNVLATAQALATLSARAAPDPTTFAAQFSSRLRAMARTHTLLLERPEGAVEVAMLVEQVLAPYRSGNARIAAGGPEVQLPAEVAVTVGMVLHELATNAAKHGALSSSAGQLTLDWTVAEGPPRRLALDWTETGGPTVPGPPGRAGFGSQLLRRALGGTPGGRAVISWRTEGVCVRLELDLPPG